MTTIPDRPYQVDDTDSSLDRSRVVAGRYEILELVGAGGMGQVLHVRHVRLGKELALKLMQPELVVDPEAAALFVREAQLASTLSHPNIVSVVDFGEDPDWGLFIAMELVRGDSLAARVGAADRLPVEIVCRVARQLALALHHSHGRGVVHGDVKSDNVLCMAGPEDSDDDWHVKLLDFGTARLQRELRGVEDEIVGTPAYLAPERALGQPPSPSNDIYSLGVVIYEMLAGTVPFWGGDVVEVLNAHLSASPEPVAARRGEVLDDSLTSIVDRCLAKEPADRFATGAELAAAIEAYMHELGIREHALAQRTGLAPHSREESAADAFDALAIPCAGLEIDGTIRLANPAFATLLGVDDPALLERVSVYDTVLGAMHPGIHEDLRLAAMLGETVRGRLLVPGDDGDEQVLRLTLAPSRGRCGPCMLTVYPLGEVAPRALRLLPEI